MIYENDGLPVPLFNLIANDSYSSGGADISATQLIDSPRVRVLNKQNAHQIVRKASKSLAATLGRAFHSAVESATKEGVAERRLSITVNGWVLSGGVDHYQDGVITDYKTANVFKVMYSESGRVDEWENQLNVYAHILREHGHPVTDVMIFVLFKDWNRRGFSEAFKKGKLWVPNKDSGYPEKDWAYYRLPLWSEERAKAYVHLRIKMHQEAEESLPLCAAKDVWRGVRCSGGYCDAAPFCSQYQRSKETGLINATT